MTDIVLHEIDQNLLERIQRIAAAHGWNVQDTLVRLIEQGLFICEGELALRLSERENDALSQAIAAMETVPDDPGFSLIGRAVSAPEVDEGPDQSIAPRFNLG